jgi:hypothetical protein
MPLTPAQENFLLYGPRDRSDDAFADKTEVLAAWAQHHEAILARYQGSGRRPWGFRAIDRPDIAWRGYSKERSTLFEAGLLTEQERSELVNFWRAEFQKAQQRLDDEGRRKHYRWADIPRSLLREWKRERRRRQKLIPLLRRARL